ncbi:PE family protein [Mycobacterium haemophilum DSM 44634]
MVYAAARTAITGVEPPSADAVSRRAAVFLVDYAKQYEVIIAEAERVLNNFADVLAIDADKYATAEADNAKAVS